MLLIQVKPLEMMPIMTKLMRITSHCMVPLHGCPNSKKNIKTELFPIKVISRRLIPVKITVIKLY